MSAAAELRTDATITSLVSKCERELRRILSSIKGRSTEELNAEPHILNHADRLADAALRHVSLLGLYIDGCVEFDGSRVRYRWPAEAEPSSSLQITKGQCLRFTSERLPRLVSARGTRAVLLFRIEESVSEALILLGYARQLRRLGTDESRELCDAVKQRIDFVAGTIQILIGLRDGDWIDASKGQAIYVGPAQISGGG